MNKPSHSSFPHSLLFVHHVINRSHLPYACPTTVSLQAHRVKGHGPRATISSFSLKLHMSGVGHSDTDGTLI